MSNIVIELENYSLNMLDENSVLQICEQTHNIKNIGKYFSTKIRQKEHWLLKLKNNELWSDRNGYLSIVDSKNRIIGLIWHFSHNIEKSFELGIDIFSTDMRGKGVGENVLIAYTNYLFDTYDINRLQYNMVEENIASEKLALKCGFKYEGLHRKALYIRGKWHNLKLYSKLKGE